MAQELVYTSADRGLRPGTRGFCTVAYTKGMRPESIQILESLSAYRNLYGVHDPKASLNPVAYTHYRYTLGGRNVSILSRVGPTRADNTLRTNKMAHHVVLSGRERPAGGPAWLCSQDDFFLDAWDDEPHTIAAPKETPKGESSVTFAAAWEKATGDAGWAGAVARAFLSRPNVPAFVIYEPGMDVLPLLSESLNLIPPEQRWHVTFSTYYFSLPAGATCCWRCCVPDPDCLREARRNPRALVIDLTRPLPPLAENALVRYAREGVAAPAGRGARQP